MKCHLLRCMSILCILTASAVEAAETKEPRTKHLTVELTDGSRLIGTAEGFDSFPFFVEKSETVSLNSVWLINTNNDGETSTIQFRDGTTRSGVIDVAQFSLRTKLGLLQVPIPLLKSLACSIDGAVDPKMTVCDPNGSTLVGRVPAGKSVSVRMAGQWVPGSNWPFIGPTGSNKLIYTGSNKWCAMLILQNPAGNAVRKVAYEGRPIVVKGDENVPLSIVVRMNDDVFGDNAHKPGDPMRCTVYAELPQQSDE